VTGLLALAACGGSGGHPGPAPSPSRSVYIAPQPTDWAISRDELQQILTGVDTALQPGFSAVGSAQTPADLSAALGAVELNLGQQASTLEALTPPRADIAAVGELAAALREISTDMTSIASDADNQNVCTGGTGLPRVSSGSGAQAFRLAFLGLNSAEAGHTYTFGAFLPPATPDPSRQPANGDLAGGEHSGSGELTINNQGTSDTVIKLVDGSTSVRDIYVQANSSTTVYSIPDGNFGAYYTTGVDWDDTNRRFTRNCDFQKFDDPLLFTTTPNANGYTYTTWTLSLDAGVMTPAGSSAAPASPITAAEFPGS
jgi:hypothetical protein